MGQNTKIECALALTDIDLLQDAQRWYEWGEWRWDNICDQCGAVFVDTTVGLTLCPACAGSPNRSDQ